LSIARAPRGASTGEALGTRRLLLTVLAPFSAGYFLSYAYRAINAIVAPDLVRDIGLDASELGVLTASYLVAFALFQIPLGVLLDRFGPRRVQATLLLVAAIGSVLFARGESAPALTVARALIGLGFAGGLMAGFKAVVLWLEPARHALANSTIMSFGGLGMIFATVPAEITMQAIGWRGLFVVSAVITVGVAALIFLVVPEHPGARHTTSVTEQIRDVGRVYADPFFWRLAPLVAATAGSQVGIHTLWAGPWFRDIMGFDRAAVALHLLGMALAFLAGTLLTGVIADVLGRRGIDQLRVMVGGLLLFGLSQVAIITEWTSVPMLIWGVFGMTGQIGVLAYPRLSNHFGRERSGRAQTAMNLLLFMSAFASQSAIGAIIDLFPTTADGGYAAQGYRSAFGALLALQALALAWYLCPTPSPAGGGRTSLLAVAAILLGLTLIGGSAALVLLG
jgi:MFS family permease